MAEDRAYAAREVHRKVYRDMYKDYSYEQLQTKRETAYQRIMALTDPRDMQGAGQMLMAEMEACNEIIEGRLNVWKQMGAKTIDWRMSLREKKDEAALNLKAAATPNGQLVLSILEDESGLSTQDLQGWCEELSELPDEDFEQLLSNLVEDGVIEKSDDKYYLITPCTTDLRVDPEFAKAYWNRLPIESSLSVCSVEKIRAIGNAILQLIEEKQEPLSGFACRYYATEEGYAEASPDFFDSERFMTRAQKENLWRTTMKRLVDSGILMEAYPSKALQGKGSEYFNDFKLSILDPFCDYAVIGYKEPVVEENEEEDDEE